MDDAVGQVIQTLKDNGMFEDTIIFFTADVRMKFELVQLLGLFLQNRMEVKL